MNDRNTKMRTHVRKAKDLCKRAEQNPDIEHLLCAQAVLELERALRSYEPEELIESPELAIDAGMVRDLAESVADGRLTLLVAVELCETARERVALDAMVYMARHGISFEEEAKR